MGNPTAESPALPYKDRRSWLIAFGVFEILLGACCLLITLFALMSLVIPRPSHTAETPAGAHAAMVVGVGFYVMIAAFFLVAGIGSILRRNWARILTLIGSGLWLFIGTLGTIFFLFLFPKIMAAQYPVQPVPQHIEHIVMGSTVLMAIVFGILLPLTFLIFYSRKSVKATCLARGATTAAGAVSSRKLPVPVIILGAWEALAAVSALFPLVSPVRATCLFGYVVRGWTAVAVVVAFSALSAAAAWLIYRMRLTGWNISLLKLLFFGVSTVLSLASGSMSQLLVEMGQTPGQEQFEYLFPQFMTVVMVATLIMCTIYLALLIYSRRFFLSATPSAAS